MIAKLVFEKPICIPFGDRKPCAEFLGSEWSITIGPTGAVRLRPIDNSHPYFFHVGTPFSYTESLGSQ